MSAERSESESWSVTRNAAKGVPERQRGRGMSATMPGCFEAETSQASGTSPCARLHLRLPVAVPLRRGNRAILVAFFINSPVTSQP